MIENKKIVFWTELFLYLFKADKATTESTDRLYKLMTYLYVELRDMGVVDNYEICYELSYDGLERMAVYTANLFSFDSSFEELHLRCNIDEALTVYRLDDTLKEIIEKFVKLS